MPFSVSSKGINGLSKKTILAKNSNTKRRRSSILSKSHITPSGGRDKLTNYQKHTVRSAAEATGSLFGSRHSGEKEYSYSSAHPRLTSDQRTVNSTQLQIEPFPPVLPLGEPHIIETKMRADDELNFPALASNYLSHIRKFSKLDRKDRLVSAMQKGLIKPKDKSEESPSNISENTEEDRLPDLNSSLTMISHVHHLKKLQRQQSRSSLGADYRDFSKGNISKRRQSMVSDDTLVDDGNTSLILQSFEDEFPDLIPLINATAHMPEEEEPIQRVKRTRVKSATLNKEKSDITEDSDDEADKKKSKDKIQRAKKIKEMNRLYQEFLKHMQELKQNSILASKLNLENYQFSNSHKLGNIDLQNVSYFSITDHSANLYTEKLIKWEFSHNQDDRYSLTIRETMRKIFARRLEQMRTEAGAPPNKLVKAEIPQLILKDLENHYRQLRNSALYRALRRETSNADAFITLQFTNLSLLSSLTGNVGLRRKSTSSM